MNFLFVDDAKLMRLYLRNTIFELRNNPRDTFLDACNGAEALTFLKTKNIDFIFLDLYMPDMNGMDVLKKIKADEKTKHIPVVILTGEGKKNVILEAINAGAADFLAKPPEKQRISEILRKIIK